MDRERIIERTDIWREGKWLDLWSIVHLFTGIFTGFILELFRFGIAASIVIALLIFVAYELWEAMVKIHETPQNRFMDVVVALVSFVPTFLFASTLSVRGFFIIWALVTVVWVTMSTIGWFASVKAAEFESRVRQEIAERKERRIKRREKRAERRAIDF